MNRPMVTRGPPRIAGEELCVSINLLQKSDEMTERTRGQPPLRLVFFRPAHIFLVCSLQAGIDATPERIRRDGKDHAHEQTEETKTALPQLEIVHVAKHQLEGTEEEIEDS